MSDVVSRVAPVLCGHGFSQEQRVPRNKTVLDSQIQRRAEKIYVCSRGGHSQFAMYAVVLITQKINKAVARFDTEKVQIVESEIRKIAMYRNALTKHKQPGHGQVFYPFATVDEIPAI